MFLQSFDIIYLLLAVGVLVLSLVLHEYAHAYVAYRNGDDTARAMGRMTLNPARHFDLVGFAMMLAVGFGYAKPVPVNPSRFNRRRYGIFTVAIAGVTVNLFLAIIASFFYSLILFVCEINTFVLLVLFLFEYMMFLNLALLFFNLLPIFPLDGFRVVESFTRAINPYRKFMQDYGQYILIGLIMLSVIVSRMGMPYYFDLLGMYIQHTAGAIMSLLKQFWQLIFGLI